MPPYLQDEAHQNAVKIWEDRNVAEALRASKSKSKKKKNKKKKQNDDMFVTGGAGWDSG